MCPLQYDFGVERSLAAAFQVKNLLITNYLATLIRTFFSRKHANKEIDDKCAGAKPKGNKKSVKKESNQRSSKGSNSIACDVCGQEFTSNTLAIQHKFKKHPEVSNKYFCSYCGMQFTIKALFDKHLGTHSSDSRKKGSHLCEDCGVEFYFSTAKEYHSKSTHKR